MTKNTVSKKSYFPTHVYQIQIGDAEALNTSLLSSIYAERDKDAKGISRSNFTELGGWHSQNDLHKKDAYAGLVGHINSSTAQLSKDLGYDPAYEIRIGTMWSIINPPGSSNRAHVHPGCLWSGVYYIHASDDAGRIEFIEPRTAHLMNQARYAPGKTRPKDCWTKVRFTPTPGKMIIFPSWLYHAVDPNMSKGDRVIISFNLSQHKK